MHSTSSAMLNLLISTYDNIPQRKYTALLLLHLKSVFDTVNHKKFISKMQNYGFRGAARNLFASFLEIRHQYVFVNNTHSNIKPLTEKFFEDLFLSSFFHITYNDIGSCSSCDQ